MNCPNEADIKRGFSLIELLVAFTLITLITGVGFASFVTYSRSQIIIQAAANIKQNLELTRSNASSFVKPEVCGTDTLSSYNVNFCSNTTCISGDEYEMTVECGGVETLVDSYTLPDNVAIENIPGGIGDCGKITYNVISGIITGTVCEFSVSGYDNTKYIEISEVGNVSINNTPVGG